MLNLQKYCHRGAAFLIAAQVFFSGQAYGELKDVNARLACDKIFSKLNGIPPDPAFLDSCGGTMAAPKTFATNEAAQAHYEAEAAKAADHPQFLKTVVTIVSRWVSEENKYLEGRAADVLATWAGAVKEDLDVRRLLWDDIIYLGNPAVAPALPAYSLANMEHHNALLALPAQQMHDALMLSTQSANGVDPNMVAGLTTLRGHCEVFANMGTNRSYIRFMLFHHLGEDIEKFHNLQVNDEWVGEDVPRAPGGETATYNNKCKGCHAGMDAMRGAFAYIDWNAGDDEGNNTGCETFHPGPDATPEQKALAVVPKFSGNPGDDLARLVAKDTVDDSWRVLWTGKTEVEWLNPVDLTPVAPGQILTGNGPAALNKVFASTGQFGRNVAREFLGFICNIEDTKVVVDSTGKSVTEDAINIHTAPELKLLRPDPAAAVNVKDLSAKAVVMCLENTLNL